MLKRIKKAAVLGSGTMGSGIAAQLANAGIPSYLLDIVPQFSDADKAKGVKADSSAFRNRIAENNKALAIKSRQFMDKADADLVTCGNMEDNLAWLSEVQWIVEAVPENLGIKKDLFKKIAPFVKPGTIVSSNTSTISITSMVEDMPLEFRQYCMGTHFFNPVRFMKLLEVIPGEDTLPEVMQFMADFGERQLGKSIVWCKDTPGFIANRFGNQAGPSAGKLMLELGLNFSEVDALLGPAIGRPPTGAFGLCDLVGLDIAVAGTGSIHDVLTDPQEKELYAMPDFFFKMLEKGMLGNKTKGGFYKRVGKDRLMLDLNTWEYSPPKAADFPSLTKAAAAKSLPEKLEAFFEGDDKGAQYVWKFLSSYFAYAAAKLPEISDDILNMDRALNWGYNHQAGPFKMWNGLDLNKYVARMEADGLTIAPWVKEMLAAGFNSFYKYENGVEYFYSVPDKKYVAVTFKPEVIVLSELKAQNKVVLSTDAATVYDLSDGVLCFDINTRNSTLTPALIDAMIQAQAELKKDEWEGMVITSAGKDFCSGIDLSVISGAIENKAWDQIDAMLKKMQDTFMAFKYSDKPVVAAPVGKALGAGCELIMQVPAVQAAAESFIGLTEVGTGLIPAGGGVKEMAMRALDRIKGTTAFTVDFLAPNFENVVGAKTSGSAKDALNLGYLRVTDSISMNADFVLGDAKKRVQDMAAAGYTAPISRAFPAPGKNQNALLQMATMGMKLAGVISEYDWLISRKVAHIMYGGDIVKGAMITEQYLLDLEREAFVSLCGEQKTQERIAHMLKTRKPLRN
ncbi:MAG: 3-hydroxyacyl-CoA dehydrogenase/enoyl-CoA hydratase family protein [Syntrophomonadaceae bacterium]|nr:3-hydroxyacyl-CoA dehydrogenase/enoyl-CoA hydratase family protein [Syntrophomonadaceae bacterium]